MPINADDYKSLMRCWATGVTIITTVGSNGPHGMTASSFTGVSLDPPLILVCISHHTHTHEHLKENDAFGVHLLRAGQEELANRCAGMNGAEGHQFPELPQAIGPWGVPLLDDCLMALVCRVRSAYDGGDHTIFLAEVHCARMGTGAPLLYFNRAYYRLEQRSAV
jgi:flavin reductase (DIM6/NTAB) family NADH-FMN oxidoreductase RutF